MVPLKNEEKRVFNYTQNLAALGTSIDRYTYIYTSMDTSASRQVSELADGC